MDDIWTKEPPQPDNDGADYYWIRFGMAVRIERVGSIIDSMYRAGITRTDCSVGPRIPPPAELAAMEELCAVTLRLVASVDETGDEADEISLYEVGQAADALLKLREGKP